MNASTSADPCRHARFRHPAPAANAPATRWRAKLRPGTESTAAAIDLPYILGSLTLLMCFRPGVYLAMGILLLAGTGNGRDRGSEIIAGIIPGSGSSLFIPAGLILAGFLIQASRCLIRHRRYMRCMAMAGISCALMPFGTVLAVFARIILPKPSGKALFEANI